MRGSLSFSLRFVLPPETETEPPTNCKAVRHLGCRSMLPALPLALSLCSTSLIIGKTKRRSAYGKSNLTLKRTAGQPQTQFDGDSQTRHTRIHFRYATSEEGSQ